MQDATPPLESSFASRYRPMANRWDEFLDDAGRARPAVRLLTDFLDGLGEMGFRQRAEQARQLVRDHGVTYSLPGDAQAGERPWTLDPLPSLLGAAEFATLAAGLAQRARVLDKILSDLYGPQKLLRDGLLPARLVLGTCTPRMSPARPTAASASCATAPRRPPARAMPWRTGW